MTSLHVFQLGGKKQHVHQGVAPNVQEASIPCSAHQATLLAHRSAQSTTLPGPICLAGDTAHLACSRLWPVHAAPAQQQRPHKSNDTDLVAALQLLHATSSASNCHCGICVCNRGRCTRWLAACVPIPPVLHAVLHHDYTDMYNHRTCE
jgi:hypothetical protein